MSSSANLWKILGIGIAVTLSSCRESSFAGGGAAARKAGVKPVPSDAPATLGTTEIFKLDGETRAPLDLVWVIDNSGSMTDNIEQVRKNFDAFMISVSKLVDVKVILLSRADGSLGLQLPATAVAQGGVQFDNVVGSHDGTQLAAAMSCPKVAASVTSSVGGVLCGVTISSRISYTMAQVGGTFQSHFRPDADRAYVFVTDDESSPMSGADFVKVINASANGKKPKVYSFRGVTQQSSSTCNIAQVGVQYGVMEQQTAGAAFDICLPDWSSSFGKLAESIKTVAKSDVTLKSAVNPETLKVYLDGVELLASDYQIVGASIKIIKVLDKSKTYELKVVYSPL